MDRLEGSEIRRLLNFKGNSRLEVKDDLTEEILEQKELVFPGGIRFCFVESKRYVGEGGEWVEYKVLYSILKYEESAKYLQYVLQQASNIVEVYLADLDVDYIRLEEFDCSRPDQYYILLCMRRDINEEIKENEIIEIFKEYEWNFNRF